MADSDQPLTRMEVLAGATGPVNINNSHFPNVGRDQYMYNRCTVHQHVGHARGRREIRETLLRLEEFNEVKQGSIIKKEDIGEPWLVPSSGEMIETAIYTAMIIPFGNEKFTVKAYTGGRKAKKKWRHEFMECCTDWRRDIPLFGYNRSSVPLLIFHGELVPIAHIEKGLGLAGDLYTEFVRTTLGCLRNELWMDPTKGRLCLGPPGPKCSRHWENDFSGITIPSDVEFLKGDTLIRYFVSTQDDWGLFAALTSTSQSGLTKEEVAYPQIISSSTNSTIALNWNVRWRSWKGCLDSDGLMSDGMTRFRLLDDQRFIGIRSCTEINPWLSQALSVFHAHGIQLDEDLSIYEFVYPYFNLTGTLQRSKRKQQRRQLWKPIYLFFLPCTSPTRHFYFWSHDSLGRIPLSRDRCRYLGLPFKLSIKPDYFCESWSTSVYKTIHKYQIARGFDPINTDFAQFMRFPIFEVVPSENRFQEVEEENIHIEESISAASSSADTINTVKKVDTSTKQGTIRSLMGALFSPLALEAVEDLGISAVAI